MTLFSRTFRSLRNRNYALYFSGQVVSTTGTWMQSVAQMWLVLRLTGSGVALGTTMALQFTPMLVAGAWGGVVADRFDKRRLLLFSQAAQALPALALGLLTVTGSARLWMVYALAFVTGWITVIDVPARQSFVSEMVAADDVSNAVALSSTVFTSSRVTGPAIAGVLIATVGVAPCFFINAASFAAVVAALALMDPSRLRRHPPVVRRRGQLSEGLRYVRSKPALLWPLVMVAIIGLMSYNFQVLLPLLASRDFHAGARGFGLLSSSMGAGSAVGALVVAGRQRPTRRVLLGSAFALGASCFLVAVLPTLGSAMAALVLLGVASVAYTSTTNSLLQLEADPQMRGRVLALFAVLFLGSTPIGGPLIGWVAQTYDARVALAVAGTAALGAALLGTFAGRRHGFAHPAVEPG